MLIEFLSKIILTVINVCHMAIKVFRSIFTTAMCKCTIITLSSRRLKLEHFSNFLTKVEYPSFGRRSLNYNYRCDCNFRSAESLTSLSNFSFNYVYEPRMPCDFPLAVLFATSTSGRFVKLKIYKT